MGRTVSRTFSRPLARGASRVPVHPLSTLPALSSPIVSTYGLPVKPFAPPIPAEFA